MPKKRLAKVSVIRSKTGEWFVRLSKNGRKIMHSETYKNLGYTQKVARMIHGGRADMELVLFKVK